MVYFPRFSGNLREFKRICLGHFAGNQAISFLWVPDALVLCPLSGIENSETSVNREIELTLSEPENQKIC